MANKGKTSLNTKESTEGWITDHAWLTGLIGAISVIACGAWFGYAETLSRGVVIAGWQLTEKRAESVLFVLILVSVIMLMVECIRIHLFSPEKQTIRLHTLIKRKHYLPFAYEAVLHYIAYLAVLTLVIVFFKSAGEYGFAKKARYYQPWFLFLEWVWQAYLWLGLPYTLVTRAFKYDPKADDKDLGTILLNRLSILGDAILRKPTNLAITNGEKKALRALLVKLFFAPLMTVFFLDQYPHLVNNLNYMSSGLLNAITSGNYTHSRFNADLFNIAVSVIFTIDVALAWVGYASSSRWVQNQTVSADPCIRGWVVCLICYPPFQMFLGLYYSAPGERDIFNFANQTVITIFSVMMVASYFVYMWSTLCFGVRFSNLTHRGVIRSGPFKWVRHPAYASKNFAWWCIMFPAIIYNMQNNGFGQGIAQIVGLALMTWVYYWRAITEEKHLSFDSQYQAYCNAVPYRFIPKVF